MELKHVVQSLLKFDWIRIADAGRWRGKSLVFYVHMYILSILKKVYTRFLPVQTLRIAWEESLATCVQHGS